MPRNPANDITALGQLRTKLTGAAGPADAFRSNGVVSPDGILQLAGNQANDKTRVYGDGRKWTPIQPSAPATLVAGQYYIETYGGLDWLVYVDSAGVAQRIRPAPQPNTVPVPVGPAVVLASFTVDDYRYALFEYTAQNKITGASVSGHYGVGNNGTTSADATIVQLAWPETHEHVWTIVGPPTRETRLELPELPDALREWRPDARPIVVAAGLFDASSYAGYDDVRRKGIALFAESPEDDEAVLRTSTTGKLAF